MTDQTPEQQLDAAYRERAHLVAWLAAVYPSVITPAPDVDEPGWQIVYLAVWGRQMSWHISPRDADLFAHVERVEPGDLRAQWDGHTTDQKYDRIRQHVRGLHFGGAAKVIKERTRRLSEDFAAYSDVADEWTAAAGWGPRVAAEPPATSETGRATFYEPDEDPAAREAQQDSRPRCQHCQMPYDPTPGSLPVAACTSIRDRIAEALHVHLACTADIRLTGGGEYAFVPEITDAERLRIAEHLAAVLPTPEQQAADEGRVGRLAEWLWDNCAEDERSGLLADDPRRIAAVALRWPELPHLTVEDEDACEDPETDEQRTDREETERDHAAGDHRYCGQTCEVEFPTEHLRNFVIAKGYPGTRGALDELLRRAAAAGTRSPNTARPDEDVTEAEPDDPSAHALASHIADHPMSVVQTAFRLLNAPLTIRLRHDGCSAACSEQHTYSEGCEPQRDLAQDEDVTEAEIDAMMAEGTPVEVIVPSVCPTRCDPDCTDPCHAAHAIPRKRDHDPADCTGAIPDAGLRGQYAAAIEYALLPPVPGRERRRLMAEQAADAVLAVRDREMEQLRAERDMLGRETDRLRRDWVALRDRAEQAEQRLRVADVTASRWSTTIGLSDIPQAHAIACIRAALTGETRPDRLGLDEAAHDALLAALNPPKEHQ